MYRYFFQLCHTHVGPSLCWPPYSKTHHVDLLCSSFSLNNTFRRLFKAQADALAAAALAPSRDRWFCTIQVWGELMELIGVIQEYV